MTPANPLEQAVSAPAPHRPYSVQMDGRVQKQDSLRAASRRRRGHSLVEILIVMAIIAIAASLIVGAAEKIYRILESWK